MKLYEPFTLILLGAVVLVCAAVSVFSIFKLGPGNAVEHVAEEVAEDVIEYETGTPVELAPELQMLEKMIIPRAPDAVQK